MVGGQVIDHVVEVAPQRAALLRQIVFGLGLGVGNEHRTGHSPIIGIGLDPGTFRALTVSQPMGSHRCRRVEVGGHQVPIPGAREFCGAGKRTHGRGCHPRKRLLERRRHVADLQFVVHRFLEADLVMLRGKIIGRARVPDRTDHLVALHHHLPAVLAVAAVHLEVGSQPARADAHDETPLGHVVEHRGIGGDSRREMVRKIQHSGAQFHALGQRNQGGQKLQRIGNRLGAL
ncbi:hypothetical protein D3C73_770260 [compost metagenome]